MKHKPTNVTVSFLRLPRLALAFALLGVLLLSGCPKAETDAGLDETVNGVTRREMAEQMERMREAGGDGTPMNSAGGGGAPGAPTSSGGGDY